MELGPTTGSRPTRMLLGCYPDQQQILVTCRPRATAPWLHPQTRLPLSKPGSSSLPVSRRHTPFTPANLRGPDAGAPKSYGRFLVTPRDPLTLAADDRDDGGTTCWYPSLQANQRAGTPHPWGPSLYINIQTTGSSAGVAAPGAPGARSFSRKEARSQRWYTVKPTAPHRCNTHSLLLWAEMLVFLLESLHNALKAGRPLAISGDFNNNVNRENLMTNTATSANSNNIHGIRSLWDTNNNTTQLLNVNHPIAAQPNPSNTNANRLDNLQVEVIAELEAFKEVGCAEWCGM